MRNGGERTNAEIEGETIRVEVLVMAGVEKSDPETHLGCITASKYIKQMIPKARQTKMSPQIIQTYAL